MVSSIVVISANTLFVPDNAQRHSILNPSYSPDTFRSEHIPEGYILDLMGVQDSNDGALSRLFASRRVPSKL